MIINKDNLTNIFIAVIITFSVFLLIQSLISRDANIKNNKKKRNYIEFIKINENDNLEDRSRVLPDKPPQPKRPPQPEVELDDSKPPPMQNIDIDIPDFDLPTDFSGAFRKCL